MPISLLHRSIESNGVLETARRLGVTLIAHSPLAGRMLTGKFHADRRLVDSMPRLRRLTGYNAKRLDRIAGLIAALRDIATQHTATITQIALAWLTSFYGETVVAIPGASKPHHADEAAVAMHVTLTTGELQRLADLSSPPTR